ncbi:MAG: hypothetical protein ACI4Q6_09560 [Huintestinicola sp.]
MRTFTIHYIFKGRKITVEVLAASAGKAFDTAQSFIPNGQIYRVEA